MIYFAKEELRQFCSENTVVDAQHEFLLGTRVALTLMPAFTWLFVRTTVDITCRTAITLSRLVSHGGAAIIMLVEHLRTDMFTDDHLLYGFMPCCLWSLVMTVQLVRTGSRVNIHIRRVDINKFLTVDLVLMILLAMTDLISPASVGMLVGREVDSLHVYLHRINGCHYLGLAIIPWIGQRFRYSEDKHGVLMSRSLSILVWFGGVGYAVATNLLPVCVGLYIFIGQMTIQLLPALIGNIICQSGPFTAGFWNSQRKAVSIDQARRQ